MTQRNKLILSLLLVTVLCVARRAAYAQTVSIDLKTAIETSIKNNESLRADSLNIIIQEYKSRELAGWFLPQVNYSSRTTYNRVIAKQMIPGSMVGQPSKEFVPVQFGTKYEAGGGIEVSQTIYRKDLLIQLRAGELQKDIAQTQYRISKEELVYQVASAYYSLQSKAQLIRNTTSDYQNLKDILDITRAQFESGTVKRIDLETVEINVANKQSQLNQLLTQYNEQLEYFKYFLGVQSSATIVISDEIAFLPELKHSENDWRDREDITLFHQFAGAKEMELKSTRAQKLPVVSGYLRHNYQSQFNQTSKAFNNDYWFESSSVGITVSVPLFDGNRRKNRERSIQTEIQQLKWQADRKKLLAQTEVVSAEQTLANNRSQHESNSRNLSLAEKVFSSRKALYTEGVTTLMELLDAEKELSQARNLHMQSLINVQTGLLNVYKANGNLLTHLSKS